jgi:hypothetical protein
MEDIEIGLTEAIGSVRSALVRAVQEGEGSPIAFRAGPVEMEFEVGFSKTKEAHGGVEVWVLSVGAKGERADTWSHRLKISLTPVSPDGKDKLIGSLGRE